MGGDFISQEKHCHCFEAAPIFESSEATAFSTSEWEGPGAVVHFSFVPLHEHFVCGQAVEFKLSYPFESQAAIFFHPTGGKHHNAFQLELDVAKRKGRVQRPSAFAATREEEQGQEWRVYYTFDVDVEQLYHCHPQ